MAIGRMSTKLTNITHNFAEFNCIGYKRDVNFNRGNMDKIKNYMYHYNSHNYVTVA